MINVVIALAIGAVAHHWLVAFAVLVIATLVAVHGFMSGARTPSMVMIAVALFTLLLDIRRLTTSTATGIRRRGRCASPSVVKSIWWRTGSPRRRKPSRK